MKQKSVFLRILSSFFAKISTPGMGEGNKGWPKRNLTKMHRSFCVIFLDTNMPEGWDIIHLKGDSSVWSTKTFLYDIRVPRGSKSK